MQTMYTVSERGTRGVAVSRDIVRSRDVTTAARV